MTPRRFRVAFSFAGEKRDFVAQVAAQLAARFGEEQILYDKYHEAEFAEPNLAFTLPNLYREQADLIVAVFCRDYERREWCGLEWRAIFSLIKAGTTKPIMLTRFDQVDGQGLHGLAGFVELDAKSAESAAALILERLAINEGHPKDHYTQPASPPASAPSAAIPNNLPRLQPFFGREQELAAIRDALDPANRSWGTLIDGPGGMGKTSLAIRAAQLAEPAQFDRIIFTSVKDRELDDDGVRYLDAKLIPGLLEMFSELARELGLIDFGKSAEADRPRLLLEALRPLKVLLILDNLESLTKAERDQLFTFVKRLPTGCKAILTSRRRIGSGADALILEQLSRDAALQTLAELAKRNKLLAKTSEAERIVLHTQTGGNPLLLRWTAGQLGRGCCRKFTDAIDYLRSCPADNDPLEFVFGDLAREFTPEETKVLAALTYFTQPATVEHIAAVAGAEVGAQVGRAVLSPPLDAAASPDAANNPTAGGAVRTPRPTSAFDLAAVELALRGLACRSLVVPDQEEKAYTLVPMVADFLRKKRPDVVAATGQHLEQRAYALILENGFREHDRFPVLDAAWPSVAPAIPLFVAGPNEHLQIVCHALSGFLNFTGRWDEWLSLNLQGEEKAVAAGDWNNAGWHAKDAGWVHYLRQQGDEVLACAERAAAHWTAAKAGTREQAIASHLRSIGHQFKQDYSAALTTAREGLELQRTQSAESEDMAISLNYVAGIEQQMKDYPAAERDYREALRIARKVKHGEGVASCIGNLANLALNREDWPGAEALAREALPLSEKVERKELIAGDNCRLAKALVQQGKRVEALPHARKAVELFTQLASPDLKEAQAILQECQA